MSIRNLMTREATLLVAGAEGEPDSDGVPTRAADTAVALLVEFQQVSGSEADLERTEVETYRVFLPSSVRPSGADRLVVDDVTYEFTGPPNPVHSPRVRRLHHWEAYVRVAS